jgi:hypothetical protein
MDLCSGVEPLNTLSATQFMNNTTVKNLQLSPTNMTSATKLPNYFLWSGNFTCFTKWRFIHRAQLGCVPLNGSQLFGNRNKKCCRYAYATETLPHVLCHCQPNFVSITKGHNVIQDRLVRAFNVLASTTVRINQVVPGLDGSLRPDFITFN